MPSIRPYVRTVNYYYTGEKLYDVTYCIWMYYVRRLPVLKFAGRGEAHAPQQ